MKIHSIPIFDDNYVWLLEDQNSSQVLVVDPGEAKPVIDYLIKHHLRLSMILITHEHPDHIGGVSELKNHYPEVQIHWNKGLKDLDQLSFQDEIIEAWNTPGHIKNHITYYSKSLNALFCGDTLFSLGCGRILEGTFEEGCNELFKSLRLIKERTNHTTKVYCTHEYTLKNLAFTQSLESDYRVSNEAELELKNKFQTLGSTLPSIMNFELQWNVFLKAKTIEEFKSLRLKRNSF